MLKKDSKRSLQWLESHRELLRERAAYSRFFDESKAPFYSVFNTGTYTLSPWKVVWRGIDTRIRAAVTSEYEGMTVIPQHIVSFISLSNETEAHYIAGVMNSTPFRFAVSCFSQPGSKSFGTPSILEKARVPKFDPSNRLHTDIAAEAKRLSTGTADVSAAIYQKLDSLSCGLWKIDEKGLKAIQDAYVELYAAGTVEQGATEADE